MTRILAAALLTIIGGLQAATRTPEAVTKELLGNWKLVKYEVFDANGATRPGRYDVGRVAYDASGEMTAHLMHAGDDHVYLGYFGPFTVDAAKGTVTHHVIGSSNASWIGTDQVRYYGFSAGGNQLTLSLKAGDRVTQTLTWTRVRSHDNAEFAESAEDVSSGKPGEFCEFREFGVVVSSFHTDASCAAWRARKVTRSSKFAKR